MGRKSTGTVRILKNEDGQPQWHAKWTRADGTRTDWEPLDPSIRLDDAAGAKAAAARMAVKVKRVSAGGGTGETVTDYAKRWCDWREERGLACVKDDRARMTNHVLAVIGPLDVRAVTRNDLERLVEHLDKRIAMGDVGWKVAGMAWSNVTRMFKDACSAKRLDLRVREDDPSKAVQAPERGMKKEKQYLWPSEFLALVSCERVPMRWRVLFALAIYTYARAGEIEALSWGDVSFETNTLHIHTSVDRVRKRGRVKSTKTGVSRRIPIEPELLPLLRALHKAAGGKGRVIAAMPSPGMLSRKLKRYLDKAGVTRAELHATGDATRKAITFHDLRATGITWMAARGDDPLRIKQRAGHATFSTTEGYIREAENLGASFGAVFPALPENIAPKSPRAISRPATTRDSSGSSWAQQGLNL
jgi:integrase